RIEMLIPQWQLQGRAVSDPTLAACNLQHEYVVGIVMNSRALITGRGEIDVGLKGMGERGLQSPAELRQGGNHVVHVRQRHRRAVGEKLIEAPHIESPAGN